MGRRFDEIARPIFRENAALGKIQGAPLPEATRLDIMVLKVVHD